jgi:MTH538 TIR-like domain (DUF1863)
MPRSVFFSFHYQQDIFRVNTVRNHATTKGGYNTAGYWDHSLWESVKKEGDTAIRRMINEGLKNTSVTVVLIGSQTARRRWVEYEIEQSHQRGNGIIGIYIHNIKCARNGVADSKGKNPFDFLEVPQPVKSIYTPVTIPMSQIYRTYDWVNDDGYKNFSQWIESAVKS